MKWFKQAQINATLPYFQEFEDMGEYIPDEGKLSEVLQNQLGSHVVRDIGSGDSGVAYLLSNGDILKITTNSQEGQIAQYFSERPNPHVIDYKLVWRDGDLYYIVMEKVENMVSDFPEISNLFDSINNLLDNYKCYNVQCAYNIVKDVADIKYPLKDQLLSYLKTLMSIPFRVYDFLNVDNVGIKNGNLIFFDIT